MVQTKVNQFLAQGIPGEYADVGPRRETGYILLSNVTEGAQSTGALAFAANPTDGDTITIGSVVYTFKDTLSAVNDIQIGSALADTLDSLEKTVNGEGAAGTDYYSGTTTPLTDVTAAVTDSTLTLTAIEDGTAGNGIALASSSSNVTVTAFSGGTDGTEVQPAVACAFTHSDEGNGYAQIGGTGLFAGVLVNPKTFANYQGLNPTLELPNGIQGGLCTFGHIYVQPAQAYEIGYIAAFNTANGVINAYANADVVPDGYAVIANAKFIKYSGDANTVATLELGN